MERAGDRAAEKGTRGNPMHYREVLRGVLERRTRGNSSYSARALARDSGTSASFMSQILKGTRALSYDRAVLVAARLGFTGERRRTFIQSVRLESCRNGAAREILAAEFSGPKRQSFASLELDRFVCVSEWYHLALLELTETRNFQSDARWIARRLGLTKIETDDAIRRLIHLGCLKKEANGTLRRVAYYRVQDVPSAAIREFHATMLRRAQQALIGQSFAERDMTGTTVAIDKSRLPEVKERIRRFREEMSAFLDAGDKTEVYQLSVQFFRISDGQVMDPHPRVSFSK